MLILPFFLSISALFTVVAVPLPVSAPFEPKTSLQNHHSTTINFDARATGILYRRAPQLKVEFRTKAQGAGRAVAKTDYDSTRALIRKHQEDPNTSDTQKRARSAYAGSGWIRGQKVEDNHRQTLKFTYHEGDTPDTKIIGKPVSISRPMPLVPMKPQFNQDVPSDHRKDILGEIDKKLPTVQPPQGCCVRLARVEDGWHTTVPTGVREVTEVSFHTGSTASSKNMIGPKPHILYRPLTILMGGAEQKGGGVKENEQAVVEKHVREAHAEYGHDDPAKKANVAVVAEGWHDSEPVNGVKHKQIVAGYYDMPDHLQVVGTDDWKYLGQRPIALMDGYKPHV